MKLITEEFIETMKPYPYYSQSQIKDPFVPVKFFNPCGSGTWFILEYDPETKTAFCYVEGMGHDELGSVSLEEMEALKLPFGLTIERDLYFKPCRLSEGSTFKTCKKTFTAGENDFAGENIFPAKLFPRKP
ncbi:MAG: DUF2958 domain-containing protein [Victivallaceae bacterium]|nr:DUF2958 domain-containing protein [Victivallaceae bacterium]